MKEHSFLHLLMPKHWTGTFFPGKSDFMDFTTHLFASFCRTLVLWVSLKYLVQKRECYWSVLNYLWCLLPTHIKNIHSRFKIFCWYILPFNLITCSWCNNQVWLCLLVWWFQFPPVRIKTKGRELGQPTESRRQIRFQCFITTWSTQKIYEQK